MTSCLASPLEGPYSVTFTVANTIHSTHALSPELFVHVRSESGDDYKHRCTIHDTGEVNEAGHPIMKASAPLEKPHRMGKFVYVELLSMDYHFAGAAFSLQSDETEGELTGSDIDHLREYSPEAVEDILTRRMADLAAHVTNTPTPSDPLTRLDRMTGLGNIKSKVKGYAQLMHFNLMRAKADLPTLTTPLHAIFTGSPGTGKTTVAKIMGEMLHDCGVLSKGHVVMRERATLIGQFYSSESEKTLEALEEARGGILFIDEAYQLYQPDDPKDPGRFVIETLMTALSDETNRDWMLILAGYETPIMQMFSLNPGLKSRIPESNFYKFEDFTEEELLEIGCRYLSHRRFKLTDLAHSALRRRLSSDYATRNESFGNARHVINLIETCIIPAMACRLATIPSPDIEELTTIHHSDIPAPDVSQSRTNYRRIGFAC